MLSLGYAFLQFPDLFISRINFIIFTTSPLYTVNIGSKTITKTTVKISNT